jgi:hypothetical protein
MRHLGSLLAGLVIAPLVWLLIAAGQPRAAQIFDRWASADTASTGDLLAPLGLLLAAGLLVGLIGTLRWSPVGPLVAGLLLLIGYAVALIRPFLLLDTLPVWRVSGARVDLAVPLTNGTLAVLGSALIVAVVSRSRWRRWPGATVGVPGTVSPSPDTPAPATDPYASITAAEYPPDTAEDLPRPNRSLIGPSPYVPVPRHAQGTNDDAGTDRSAEVDDTAPPPASPWAGPPRPPKG